MLSPVLKNVLTRYISIYKRSPQDYLFMKDRNRGRRMEPGVPKSSSTVR